MMNKSIVSTSQRQAQPNPSVEGIHGDQDDMIRTPSTNKSHLTADNTTLKKSGP